MSKGTKAITLARVSTKEQEQGYSIEAQKHRLNEYCNRLNLEIIQGFELIESSSIADRKKVHGNDQVCEEAKRNDSHRR